MKKKAAFLVAGALAGTFAFSAGLWSLYPENREAVADLGRAIGILEKLPPEAQPTLAFIRTDASLITGYQPAAAARGCTQDGKIARLIYRMAITADERREEILNHPRVNRNEQKYATLRRDAIASLVEARWQAEAQKINSITGADYFTGRETGGALQAWLADRAAELYRLHGLKVSFEVNAATGLEILEPPGAGPNACAPAPAPTQ